jgi:hypothetical protein
MFSQPIAVLMALLCATAARAAPAYVRPMNGDCITMGSGTADLSTAGLSLYPEQFMLVGDEAAQDTFFTEASPRIGRHAYGPAHAPPAPPLATRRCQPAPEAGSPFWQPAPEADSPRWQPAIHCFGGWIDGRPCSCAVPAWSRDRGTATAPRRAQSAEAPPARGPSSSLNCISPA